MTGRIYGLLAEFTTPEALEEAALRVHRQGFRRIEAYTPFPVPAVEEALERRNWLPLVVFIGGALGTITAYVMQVYIAVYDYPINVGGRPLHSWPSFVVIMFELTVLFAALAAFFGTLFFCGFPTPYHPISNVPMFQEASRERFFLYVEARDPLFRLDETKELLMGLGSDRVEQVEA